ncbi:MAG: aldo/keto reductase [Peptococcaceae bacterium]|jgi:predicted aldo/keto reductase-like oxidoreductase|nr:aldo/keto reductase [Peptococcaceae bacterium]
MMQYRTFGKLDWKVSVLGFGAMRLPTDTDAEGNSTIIESEAIRIIRHAIDNGVNYVDTAYRYVNGQSEYLVGKALKDGYRDKVRLATKAPMPMIKTAADYDRILDEQLKKLDQDYIDFYLFHGLSKASWRLIVDQEILPHAEAALKAGKIGHIGFSFHDDYNAFEEIVNGYDKWTLCQVQYNLMDEENQAGTKGVELAASKGLAVVVMEPLRGGKLSAPVKEVAEAMDKFGYKETLPNLALQWVWNHPEVSVALSGMSTMEQVQENLVSADRSSAGSLSKEELALVKEIEAIYRQRPGIPCTSCRYCMPCPQGIDIPRMLGTYNEALVYDYYVESKRTYGMFGGTAGKCVQCKECEGKCPQTIPISEWMGKIKEIFEPA